MPKKQETSTPRREVATMLRDIYKGSPAAGRGTRQSLSILLHHMARAVEVGITGKEKAELYLEIAASEKYVPGLEHFERYTRGVWRRQQGIEPEPLPATAAPPAEQSDVSKTRLAEFESWRALSAGHAAEYDARFPLGGLYEIESELLAAHGIRKGDIYRFTLDGDVEHGELAAISTYLLDKKKRVTYIGWLCVEGSHFCFRQDSPLGCDDDHFEADEITIVGRVVRVERGGLPVRLKGLELRGLPWADEPTVPTKENLA
jgi:hypothetical protein